MITVLRTAGLRVIIFVDDHEPGHVHVFGDGRAKINLVGAEGTAELIWVDGMKRSDVLRAMAATEAHRGELLARWREIHG